MELLILSAILLMFPAVLSAYIDPGTTSVIFSSLAYLLAILSAFIGILILPFRRCFHYLSARIKQKGWALGICVTALLAIAFIGTAVVYLVM